MSLLSGGLNDFVFRRYIYGGRHPLGWFVAMVGGVWTAVFGVAMVVSTGGVTWRAWPISMGAGLASVAANLLFIGSFRHVPAGTGSTIYRLNLVIVAILGVTVLGEPVTMFKVVGVALGLGAVLLMRNGGDGHEPLRGWALTALAAACVLRACMGILYKLANTHDIPPFETLTFGGVWWIAGGAIFTLFRGERLHRPARMAGFAGLSGLLVCGIVYGLLMATRLADASVVVPIAQLSFIVTTVLGMAIDRECMDGRKAGALALAAACIYALSRSQA